MSELCPKSPTIGGPHRWTRRREGIWCVYCRKARWGEELPVNAVAIIEEQPVPEQLVVGKYTLGRYPLGGYWILKDDGEGMQVPEAKFEQLIDDFFKREL